MNVIDKIKFEEEKQIILDLFEKYFLKEKNVKINQDGHVVELKIKNKKIKKIPESLEKLVYLEKLNLNGNHIVKIKGLENLTHLIELDLGLNYISKIEGLDNLNQLETLILGANNITRVEGLGNLEKLDYLDLSFNEFSKTEKKIAKNKPYLVVEYCKKEEAEEKAKILELINLASKYFDEKDYSNAIEYYEKVADIEPKDIEVLKKLATSYYELKNNLKAIEIWEKIIKYKPDDASSWFSIGSAYLNLKNYEKSIEYYKKSAELDPKHKHVLRCLGRAYFGLRDKAKMNLERAISFFIKQTQIYPNDALNWDNLGLAYQIQGENEEAIDCAKKAVKLDPQSKSGWRSLGYAYLGLKVSITNLEKAIEIFEKHIEINPEDEQTYSLINALKEKAVLMRKTGEIEPSSVGSKEKKLDPKQFEKLKKMLRVSTKINFDMMRNALNMDEETFDNVIFDWAAEYGFIIDGDQIIINRENVKEFIDKLDSDLTK